MKALGTTLSRLEKDIGKSMAIATHPVRKKFAKMLRRKYKSLGFHIQHEPIKVKVSKKKLTITAEGAHLLEKGTGAFFTGPKARRSRATGKPYEVKVRRKKTLLGAIGAIDQNKGRMYLGRQVFGKHATIRGMRPKPVVGGVVDDLTELIPALTAPGLFQRIEGMVAFE